MERICSLESALRQREMSLQKLSAQLRSKDVNQSHLHTILDVPRGEFCLDCGSKRKNTVSEVGPLVAECNSTWSWTKTNKQKNTGKQNINSKHREGNTLGKWKGY